jgi:FAD/FMN-containing dehydrogenase
LSDDVIGILDEQFAGREGAYTNYMDDDEDGVRIKQAFGENFPRPQKLKDRYDPANVFHRNQNIPPSD